MISEINPEDYLAILDLISRYSYYYDENQIDEFMELFTDDAEVDLVAYSKGKEDIRRQVTERRLSLGEQGIQLRHHQTIMVLNSIDDETLHGKTYVLLTWHHRDTSNLELRYSGVYDDVYVKTGDGWKFRKRFS